MKVVLKRLRNVLLALVILFLAFLLISFINHRIRLSKEDKHFVAIGQREEVNGYKLNVYSEGEGTTTIFLCPVVEPVRLFWILSRCILY